MHRADDNHAAADIVRLPVGAFQISSDAHADVVWSRQAQDISSARMAVFPAAFGICTFQTPGRRIWVCSKGIRGMLAQCLPACCDYDSLASEQGVIGLPHRVLQHRRNCCFGSVKLIERQAVPEDCTHREGMMGLPQGLPGL